MSIYSVNTSLTSILKKYSCDEREKAKNTILNKVRFDLTEKKCNINSIIEDVLNKKNYVQLNEFISYLKQDSIDDKHLLKTIRDVRQSIHLLDSSKFKEFLITLISINWIEKNHNNDELIQSYVDFYLTLMISHNEYTFNCVSNLITFWIPKDNDHDCWIKSIPNDEIHKRLEITHKLLNEILNVIPMSFDIVLELIEKCFPYYKKPSFVIGGYVYNCLWLLQYKPIFAQHILQLLFKKLVVLDVNAPRNEIEACEDEDENEDNEDSCNLEDDNSMQHEIAEKLDVCMEKLFDYLDKFKTSDNYEILQFFKILLNCFNNVILSSHNIHHTQFMLFYFCSFKPILVEKFLCNLWDKITNPNVPASIRQVSVGYIVSFLARAKFVSMITVKNYIMEMCNWAHQYIQNGSDSMRLNNSLKANVVFYSICQALFYIIAFRSRDLTANKNGLLFLQSLQLSTLVTCNLNPLKVCLPTIATAFAGVTRAYQLAYCHTILERNARRKLATVYSNNEILFPEEFLDTFFPFDPYLLKKSGKRITPIYLKYRASEAEELNNDEIKKPIEDTKLITKQLNGRRKRGDSEVCDDFIDDFLKIDKKQKLQNEFSVLSTSNE